MNILVSSDTDVCVVFNTGTSTWTVSGHKVWPGSPTTQQEWVVVEGNGATLEVALKEYAAKYKKARKPRRR